MSKQASSSINMKLPLFGDAMSFQNHNQFIITAEHSQIQGSYPRGISLAYVRPSIEQQLRQVQMPTTDSSVERSRPIDTRLINISTSVKQQRRRLCVPSLACDEQRR
eukprot:TRINITY_DN7936_c0_g1_i1.p2 TRINITY_DN7936_c0_g1~~TRINITY_DN7936_c0_g1_i1.p2  ORF type:complete len:107 (-),score=9.06 TRINITY_DN7936_c0_g1_i1:181-501(-)